MNLGVSNDIRIQHAHTRRREHVDRRLVSKCREPFDHASERAEHPCHLSCSGCGTLVPPAASDPHRDRNVVQAQCPHCGGRAWIDLAEDDAARNLAAIETYEHGTIDRGRRLGGWVIRIGGSAAMVVLWFTTVLNSYSAIFDVLTTLLVLLTVPYFLLGFGQAKHVEKRELPYRWALPLPPTVQALEDGVEISGTVSSRDGRTLQAPLSGRACLGYVVHVRRESAPSNAPAALVAQDAVDLQVGDRCVHANAMRLDVSTSPVRLVDTQRETGLAYLRQMGLLDSEGPWLLEEGIVTAGDTIALRPADGGGTILTTLHARRMLLRGSRDPADYSPYQPRSSSARRACRAMSEPASQPMRIE